MVQVSGSALPASSEEWNGLFARVGSELRTLADAVTNLQAFLTPLVGDVVSRDPQAITRLQDFDVLEQSLHALSDFMAFLDRSTVLTDVDALARGMQGIRVADLAKRLSSASGPNKERPDASVLELF